MEVNFKQVHQKVLHTVEEQAKSRTFRAANVLKKASNKVLSNSAGRTGKVYRKPSTKSATYTASAPGEPPALRSGNLRNSWRPLPYAEMAGSDKVFTPGIRTDVVYAPMLQSGTRKMAARPFEDKVKQEAWPEVEQIYSQPYIM